MSPLHFVHVILGTECPFAEQFSSTVFSVVTFHLLWRLDCKLRLHIDYQSCHGVWCAQGVSIAVQMYVPASFLSVFVMVKVRPCTVALSLGSWSKSLVQDTTGGGYPMTRHSGCLRSFPLSAYIGPVGRKMSGRAARVKPRYLYTAGDF